MTVKPLPFNPKLKRPLERRAVTIVAGFKCVDGIVICADTQETVNKISKRSVPKLRFEPSGLEGALLTLGTPNPLAVAFCGATDDGVFLDMLIDKAWKAAESATSLAEACESIEESIKETYKEYGSIYQTGYCPTAEIIYGVKMDNDSKLF